MARKEFTEEEIAILKTSPHSKHPAIEAGCSFFTACSMLPETLTDIFGAPVMRSHLY